jgi:hypothetical protein
LDRIEDEGQFTLGAANMISERQFAQLFNNFWHPLLPGSRALLKTVNQQVYQFSDRVTQVANTGTRAISSELGFRLFVSCTKGELSGPLSISDPRVQEIGIETARYIGRLAGPSVMTAGDGAVDDATLNDALVECRQLELFASKIPKNWAPLIVQPRVPGCGIVESCAADLLAGEALFEVKSRAGPFEQADLRQLLTYAALMHLEEPDQVGVVGFANPHLGRAVSVNLEAAVFALGSVSVSQFAAMLAEACSQDLASR